MQISRDAAQRLARIRQELEGAKAPSFLPELLAQIEPMRRKTRAAVCIPVAAFGEQEINTLPRTLAELRGQRGSVPFEIVLFLNRPHGEQRDKTARIARCEQRRMHNLHVIEGEIPCSVLTIGHIRALMHAVVSERARRAGIANLVHIVTDADMVRLHPYLVDAHMSRLEATGADACIGQLDWDHPDLPTHEIPAVIVGAAVMRLMPKYANKRLIEEAARGVPVDSSLLEEVVFARNFGRGVLANVSIRDEVYRRVGGYQPLAHGEDYDLMQRVWESGRRAGHLGALCFGWEGHGITVASSSRRALWALHAEELPATRQWDYAGYSGPGMHGAVPDMNGYRAAADLGLVTRLINESLVAFPFPADVLAHAVPATLREMGLRRDDYALLMLPVPEEPRLSIAEIVIIEPSGLKAWLEREQAAHPPGTVLSSVTS